MATPSNPGETLAECRILIVGHSGSGKSTLGNKLLDHPYPGADKEANSKHEDVAEGGFIVSSGFDSGTELNQYQTGSGLINGREFSLKVVDTPGLFDPVEHNIRQALIEITRSLALCCPGGPHIIIFVVPYGRFTEEREKSFDAIMELFKDGVKSHMMIVFTRGEQLQGKSMKEELKKSQAKGVKKILAVVEDNYVVCSNLPDRQSAERNAVLEMVGKVSHNCTVHYSDELFMNMTDYIEKEINKLMATKRLSYAQAIREVRNKIIKAEDNKAFWTGLFKLVAGSALFATFVAFFSFFSGVSLAVETMLIM